MLNMIDKTINFLGLKKFFYNSYFIYYIMEFEEGLPQNSNGIFDIPKWEKPQLNEIQESCTKIKKCKNLVIQNMTRL